jgi:hypothetical protein
MTVIANDGTILFRPRHRLLRGLACVVVLVGLIASGLTALYHDFVKGVGSAVGAAMAVVVESGAVKAAEAANVASSAGVGVGQVTIAQAQHGDSTNHWVSGAVASTSFNVVSLDSAGDRLATAVEPGGRLWTCGFLLHI